MIDDSIYGVVDGEENNGNKVNLKLMEMEVEKSKQI